MLQFFVAVLFILSWGLATWYFVWDSRGKHGAARFWIPVKGLVVALVITWLGRMLLAWVFPIFFAMVGSILTIVIIGAAILAIFVAWSSVFASIRARG